VLFDFKEFEKHLGHVMRLPAELAKAYKGESGSDQYIEARGILEALAKLYKVWKQRLIKIKE